MSKDDAIEAVMVVKLGKYGEVQPGGIHLGDGCSMVSGSGNVQERYHRQGMPTPTHGERWDAAYSGGSPSPCVSLFPQPFFHIPLLFAVFLDHMGEAIAHIKVLPQVVRFMHKTTVRAVSPCLDKCLPL